MKKNPKKREFNSFNLFDSSLSSEIKISNLSLNRFPNIIFVSFFFCFIDLVESFARVGDGVYSRLLRLNRLAMRFEFRRAKFTFEWREERVSHCCLTVVCTHAHTDTLSTTKSNSKWEWMWGYVPVHDSNECKTREQLSYRVPYDSISFCYSLSLSTSSVLFCRFYLIFGCEFYTVFGSISIPNHITNFEYFFIGKIYRYTSHHTTAWIDWKRNTKSMRFVPTTACQSDEIVQFVCVREMERPKSQSSIVNYDWV